ncbi:peptidoglycan DD-metalloendopeptidase family protein [Mucilaginibacter robiniae]|uniref:Peptidoglycan DD-metalloendopeptidase family protein n=1 Tax=Mucilaginibacter robiniae TaxID=2728022 RepID=A0A7L5E3R0_9SPHI|nr:urea transporter [Mucilaginibacter robiniae]QJD96304.1 peptidoglycan DD-metalloendopeptidase family protein [Mucilaginibacter robiniae]
MKKRILYFIQALLNSYAILFFSQNSVLGALLVVVSFFNPVAGLAGLVCVCGTLLIVNQLSYQRENIQAGLYSFNTLLIGIGIGSFYHVNAAFCVWLAVACIFTLILTVVLTSWLGKYGLPVLTVPFVLGFWMILLAASSYAEIGLLPKQSYLLNELSAGQVIEPHILFASFNNVQLPYYIKLFFRAISALFFQDSVVAGLVMSVGLFVHSRISFSLLVLGFAVACAFNAWLGIYPEGIGHYHLGVNFMMVALAIGGFFLIPSLYSYLWAIISVPVAFLLVGAFTKMLSVYSLPALSLPFCVLTILLLYFFILRTGAGKLQLTPLQHYSPETNLYLYLNNKDRLRNLQYLKLNLPFLGSWTVSQGYNGDITHQGGWAQALDFVIQDEDDKTYQESGTRPEHFYCFNKPVLACADGIVEAVVDYVEDNEIGTINLQQNWGNTVIIKHLTGVYSKVSHLRQYSIKVKAGEFVKQGDFLGLCGNSGRSPEPHLHFQIQTLPYIGSKTLPYPFAYYLKQQTDKDARLCSYQIPAQGTTISAVDVSLPLKQAFNLQPGYSAVITTQDGRHETWEVHTDTLNQTYLYSVETGATAYFINNGTAFYFTSFYGYQGSLLYYFYLAAYKIIFTADAEVKTTDVFPLQLEGYQPGLWLQDVLAPFYQFIKRTYESGVSYSSGKFIIQSAEYKVTPGRRKLVMQAALHISNNSLSAFTITLNGKTTEAKWHIPSTY